MSNHFSINSASLRLTILIASFGLFQMSCSSDSKKVSKTSAAATVDDDGVLVIEGGGSETAETNDNVTEGPKIYTPIDAFQLTTHEFVVEKCGSCHAKTNTPFFASDDVETAFDELYTGNKIDVLRIDNSRLIKRLNPEQHYCWDGDCDKSAAEMKAKLTDWIGEINDGTIEKLKADAVRYSTPSQLLADTVTIDNPDLGKNPQEFLFEAEKGVLVGLTATDDETVSGAKYVTMAAGGTISYDFMVTEAGTYTVFGLSSSIAGAQEANITISTGGNAVAGANNIRWDAGVTGEDAWAWTRSGRNGTDVEAALTPGLHTILVTNRNVDFKLDAFSITSNLDFTSAEIPTDQVAVLKFDLSKTQDATIPAGVTFEIQVKVFDENSYILKNPAIYVESGSVDIKGIKILLNGAWDPQNATYMYIDETITAPGTILATAPMLMSIEKSPTEDQISVQFEAIK